MRIATTIALFVAILCAFSCIKPPRITTQAEADLVIGHLHVTLPAHWKWLSPAPLKLEPGDPECACPSFEAKTSGILLPRILAGPDTLVLDTVHSIFWPGDCYEGCYYSYRQVREGRKISALLKQNQQSRAAVTAHPLDHKVLPAFIEKELAGITLFAMNGRQHIFGRSGLYYSGNLRQPPFNLYGRFIQQQTMEDLYAVWRSARWQR
jgi:hypothetical protein